MTRRLHPAAWSILLAAPLACGQTDMDVSVPFTEDDGADPAVVERQRFDTGWHIWAERDRRRRNGGAGTARVRAERDTTPADERFDDITPEAVSSPPRLPVARNTGGPSVLHVQILLDRAGFSPGVLDGVWGQNSAKALYWFQDAEGLERTERVDSATYARLAELTADSEPLMLYGVTTDDLSGPFIGSLPDDIYERETLRCQCYTSPAEMLSETFHITPEVLRQLNPDVDFDDLSEGTTVWVPNVEDASTPDPASGTVARIVISTNGYYTHALDEDGDILFHFPSTLGADYDPSPTGDFHVAGITHDPHFHYQPTLFAEVPDDRPEAVLPPGPNSPVGIVWMGLSKPHYGIHGTAEPHMIGYTSSHGCVRLTNWDAQRLAIHTPEGTPVEFR